MYPDISLHIDGSWGKASGGKTIPVLNPATGDPIGTVAHAEQKDLERAARAAEKGFHAWRKVSAYERYKLMRKAGENLRSRADEIARLMTTEQGKPVAEAKLETLAAADVIDWFAEEGRRAYGWIIPARAEGFYQLAVKEPVGPVAAFTPWNFPINQAVRKISGALAAIDSAAADARRQIVQAAGAPVRAAIDLVGSEQTSALGFDVLPKGGKLVIVGLFGGAAPWSLPLIPIKAATIQGSYVGSLAELKALLDLVRRKSVAPIPITRRPLQQAQQSLEDLRSGSLVGRTVLTP